MWRYDVNASKLGPGPEKRSVLGVVLEGGLAAPLPHGLLLQDGDAADITEQEPDEDGRRHAQVLGAPHHGRGGEPQARPLQNLAKIVWVAAVGPESALDELPLQPDEGD